MTQNMAVPSGNYEFQSELFITVCESTFNPAARRTPPEPSTGKGEGVNVRLTN
jgi:hypothetical protein